MYLEDVLSFKKPGGGGGGSSGGSRPIRLRNFSFDWRILVAILVPIIGGWLGALSMRGQVKDPDGKAWYQLLDKPSWTPPNWLFAPMWLLLYSTMGTASYLVYLACDEFTTDEWIFPITLYGIQLVLNWTWTPIFFKLHQLGWAFGHMLVLDAVAVACTVAFFLKSSIAGYLMLPYLAWLAYASCLNYSVWQRNKMNTYELQE